MNYDAVAVRKMNVDPSKWRWFNQNYDQHRRPDPVPGVAWRKGSTVKVGMRQTHYFFLCFYAFVILLTEFGTGGFFQGAVVINGAILLGIAWMCFSKAIFIRVIGYIIFGLTAISGLLLLQTQYQAQGVLALVAVVVPYGIMLLRHKSIKRHSYLVADGQNLSGLELWNDPSRRVWGNAGGVASAVEKFGAEAVAAGVKGEENTLLLLDMLLAIPGTTVYHGLKFPGSKDADVDHAVVHGSNVYLIDSKLYRWGAYEWQEAAGGDLIARSDGYGRPRKNHMAAAAQGYRALLGPSVNVVPIVLIHGKKVSINGSTWSRSGVGMFIAHDAIDYIGNGIGDNIRGWRDDVAARSIMLRNMKPW